MAHLTQQELWLAIRAFNKALVEQGYQPCVKVVNNGTPSQQVRPFAGPYVCVREGPQAA